MLSFLIHLIIHSKYFPNSGQDRIPVKITISIRKKQWYADVLGPFLALEQFLPVLITQFSAICVIIHGLPYEVVTQSFHIARRIIMLLLRFLRNLLFLLYFSVSSFLLNLFLLRLRKQFAGKFLLTRSILDISEILGVKQGALRSMWK